MGIPIDGWTSVIDDGIAYVDGAGFSRNQIAEMVGGELIRSLNDKGWNNVAISVMVDDEEVVDLRIGLSDNEFQIVRDPAFDFKRPGVCPERGVD